MGSNFGPITGSSLGGGIQVIAVPETAMRKPAGVTIDWSTVAAVSGADVTLNDGTVVPIGKKYIRYGTVLVKITASGLYGPAATSAGGATAATDGRQTIDATRRGEVFILNQTLFEDDPGSNIAGDLLEGGSMHKERILMAGTGQPTKANLEAALPGLRYVNA